MGQVYKARDTRLDRTVAVKLLPPDLADKPDRRRRFEIEARVISSLSHPHICPLFDVGEDQGRAFIVMEYLEGDTLDDRLTRGALPAPDVLRYGGQIADALDHAHRAQIVHRDLKPSNVMLTRSGAKLLDFGLAKGLEVPPPGLLSTASFDQRKMTAEGTVIGTVQYMAPEQLEGRQADSRTDIFAFGVLLYEMATGRKAFGGESQASLIASILTSQPPPVSSARAPNPALPPALDHIVERCLEKNPADRWQTARDIKLELDWSTKSGSQSSQPTRHVSSWRTLRAREVLAWALAAVALAIAASVALLILRKPAIETTRFTIPPPTGAIIGSGLNRRRITISPDGRHFAFVAIQGGREQIWVRSLGSLDARPLPGTDGGNAPFWSPDSRFIGFFVNAAGELKKVDASGGPARTICAATSDGNSTWGRDGTILFTQSGGSIYRVSSDGGTPVPVTHLDKTQRELDHRWPSFLPDGRRFLYMATALDANGLRATPTVYAASVDSTDRTLVARMHSGMVYSPTGHVLFVEDGVLMAQRFDTTALQLDGDPVKIADGLAYYKGLGTAGFTISDTGVLAYHGSDDALQLVWYDRRGVMTETGWDPQIFDAFRVSPDTQSLAVALIDPNTGLTDIWIYDVSRGAPTRFTSDGYASAPVWSPDGRRIALGTGRSGPPAIIAKALDGSEEKLADPTNPLNPEDWSSDGQLIVYMKSTRIRGNDLWLLPLADKQKAHSFVDTEAHEWGARFSPDSAWLAFVSNESGAPEVYVVRVRGGEKKRISVGGGSTPRWRRDGKELFYAAADNRSIMSVPVELGSTFKAGVPSRLFTMRAQAASRFGLRSTGFEVWPNGERFLMTVPVAEPASSRITVVLNWTEALKRPRTN
jgi:serine/threonine protein kinase